MIIKNPRVILRRHRVGSDDVIQSFESFQKFVGTLLAGTSVVVLVEQSMTGTSDWVEVCTFTLDQLGQEVDTDLVRVAMPYVRASIVSMTGATPRVIVYMGN